jgi:hypothetical protein
MFSPIHMCTVLCLVLLGAQIVCNTTVGAGAGLVWYVTIDGQRSVAPSTSYGPPVISAFSGVSTDASTNGGDVVVILGSYMSTQPFLGLVTYGRSGTEFTARNCTVTTPHYAISCTTLPGTGRVLRWLVTVGNQPSQLSIPTTSYAAPSISSVTPANGLTVGGGIVTISGQNFGLAYAASSITVYVNNRMSPKPAPAVMAAWQAALLAGQASPSAAVDSWVGGLAKFTPATSMVGASYR